MQFILASKRFRVSSTTENVDRISSLPDDVICHILSFLPTKNSVRTRVLSTRWKHLFSLVPVLDFSIFTYCYTPKPKHGEEFIRLSPFFKFVDWVFNSYNVHNMDTFRYISYVSHPQTSRLPSWISESIRRKVRRLEIYMDLEVPSMNLMLPCDIFTCKTLTNLSLQGGFRLPVPEDVCLPHLRTLRLSRLVFTDGVSARRLFQSCSLLEDLFLDYCQMGRKDSELYDISAPSLRNLTIHYGFKLNVKLVLNCPNLKYLMYSSWPGGREAYTRQGLKMLPIAHISYGAEFEEQYEALEKLVNAVCNFVRHLIFTGSTWKAFQIWGKSFPLFFNLTHLDIENMSCPNLELVLDLLERTPHLQVLVVDNVGYHGKGHHIQVLPKRVPACVSLHLKKVELKGFMKLENEFKMVEYFLKNAKILDMLKIQVTCSSSRPRKQIVIINKLLSFSKSSRACEIVLL